MSLGAPLRMPLPDPVLSANLFCDGHLDELLREVVAPFADELRRQAPEGYVWTVRYGRRGQHLKVRVHAPDELGSTLGELLAERAERFFATLPPAAGERLPRREVPPIDPEDEGDDLAPDQTLVPTSYRRSHVSLGGQPLLGEDAYAARATECLGRGCELVLAALAGGADAAGLRQKVLLKALLAGLPAAGFDLPERAVGYLRYHRDWLLRFFLADAEEERVALDRLDQQVERMAPTVASLRRFGLAEAPGGDEAEPWPAALARLRAYLEPRRERPELRTDPFAPDAVHPAFFKVFHGTANQAGVRPLEEAYVHHLLIAALADEPAAAAAAGGAA
jgi:hypothetical protein